MARLVQIREYIMLRRPPRSRLAERIAEGWRPCFAIDDDAIVETRSRVIVVLTRVR